MKNIVIGGLVGIVIMIVVGIPMVCVLCIEWVPTEVKPELSFITEVKPELSFRDEVELYKKAVLQRISLESKPEPVPLVDIIQKVKPGVVHIMCPEWQGSGFVVGSNLIMTARHCVEGVEDFNITTQDGHKLHATRAISSKDHDIAFIYIDDLICSRQAFEKGTCEDKSHEVKLNILELGSIKDCQLGQQVFVVGSPYGKVNFNAVSLGIISGLDVDWSPLGEDYGWEIAFTTDSAGHPGNSGGPVFTLDGKVRGILVGGFSPVLISVMPCDLFLDDIDEIEFMFKQDEYQKEVAPVYNPNDWMAADGTEYY